MHDLPTGYENIWKIFHIQGLRLIGCTIIWQITDAWALKNFGCETHVDTNAEVLNPVSQMPHNDEDQFSVFFFFFFYKKELLYPMIYFIIC